MQKTITEEMLSHLRENVEKGMSAKRYNHTKEVEKMAARLAEIYCPEKILELRAAALLHDKIGRASCRERVCLSV